MENNILTRNKEQEVVMTALYDCLTYIDMDSEMEVEEILKSVYGKEEYSDVPFYGKNIIIKSLINLNEVIDAFQSNMPKWKFSRLNRVERSILIMSYSNYFFIKETNKKIIIDVAVNLAKKFCDKDDYKFVNAILDKTLS